MKTQRMPVLFIGHGSPMNAIEVNEFSQTWRKIGVTLPRPKAILCVSAHWQTHDTSVTGAAHPQTIHDFMGFPQELFDVEYPAEGSEGLVGQVKRLLPDVKIDQKWGLDHGTWSVLHPMYPLADIPVVQLSLGRIHDPAAHYALGQALRPLRDEGILILGSGNIVHNLREAIFNNIAFDWATKYDRLVKEWILKGDHEAVIHYEKHGKSAELSVNSAEHYLPLLYVLGASEADEVTQFSCESVTMGSLSMRCVQIG
jgi:4,5-DOPA dioxygenase extradiol